MCSVHVAGQRLVEVGRLVLDGAACVSGGLRVFAGAVFWQDAIVAV